MSIIRPPTTNAELEWPEIGSVVADLSTLSRSDISPEVLARELLDRTIRLLAAVGGSVWLIDRPSSLRLLYQIGGDVLGADAVETRKRARIKVLETRATEVTLVDSSGQVIEPNGETEWLLIISPILQDDNAVGLFEIVQRPVDAESLRGNRRFLELVCQVASDYLVRCELRQLRQIQNLTAFVQKLHGTLDLNSVAYELVNEGRRLTGCDRISVAIRRGGGFKILAISGVDTIDRRAHAVQSLEKLASAVAKTGEPFWHDGAKREGPPQILDPLHKYFDESHVRCCGILPMRGPKLQREGTGDREQAFAALIVEQFRGVLARQQRKQAQSIVDEAQSALLNGLRYESLPTLPFANRRDVLAQGSWVRSWKTYAAAGACVAVAICFVPADFGVYAEGKLQPQTRKEVFAPMDGRVTRLPVRHGEQVKAGSTLVELSSPELDVEIQRVHGEYDTTRKRLSVVQSSLLEAGSSKDRDSDRAGQFAAEEEELTKLLESQQLQLALLAKERERLVVRSPMDGAVLTWDVEQLLKDRPVERGQSLLSIGDLTGRWIAEIDVRDDQIGYLADWQSSASTPLAASFQLATDRRQDYRGTVRQIGMRTELSDDHRPVVRLIVDFDGSTTQELRPGATVFARIHCGHRSLGYVWFHRLMERVRGWMFYWAG